MNHALIEKALWILASVTLLAANLYSLANLVRSK